MVNENRFKQYKDIIKKVIAKGVTNYNTQFEVYSLLKGIESEFGLEDKDIRDYAMKISTQVHKYSEYMAGHDVANSDKYSELYWQFLLFEAPYIFDSYLLYLEKKREPSAKFYEPKKRQLNKHGLIQAMQDLEDDNLDLVSISMPPGTQKTTLLKFFASWIIGRYPEDYSLFFSHSGDITRMFYDGVLDIITNTSEYTWNEIFPNCTVTKTDAKREQININKYKPFPNLQTSSVGSKNAGKVRCNRYLFSDDLIGGIEEALNKNRLDKLWSIYSVDARQRKLNQQVKEILIATRWSVHDPIGRLQRAYEGDERKRFISMPDIDPVTGESNFDYDYNGMSVEFFHDQEKLMDEISYKCLYKNEPIEREGLLYNEDELRRYLTLPLGKPDAVLGICDTKEKGSDYMFLPCVYQYGNDYYAVDCICDNNSDYGIQYERLSDIIIRNKMQKLQVEGNVGGNRIAYELAKRVEHVWNGCNITTRQTTKNKETKIIVNAEWVKKNVIFKDKSMYSPKDDYGRMMGFLLSYSILGKNDFDDVCDGWAMFSEFVQTGFGASVKAIQNPLWGMR